MARPPLEVGRAPLPVSAEVMTVVWDADFGGPVLSLASSEGLKLCRLSADGDVRVHKEITVDEPERRVRGADYCASIDCLPNGGVVCVSSHRAHEDTTRELQRYLGSDFKYDHGWRASLHQAGRSNTQKLCALSDGNTLAYGRGEDDDDDESFIVCVFSEREGGACSGVYQLEDELGAQAVGITCVAEASSPALLAVALTESNGGRSESRLVHLRLNRYDVSGSDEEEEVPESVTRLNIDDEDSCAVAVGTREACSVRRLARIPDLKDTFLAVTGAGEVLVVWRTGERLMQWVPDAGTAAATGASASTSGATPRVLDACAQGTNVWVVTQTGAKSAATSALTCLSVADLLQWRPSVHRYLPAAFRRRIRALLILHARAQRGATEGDTDAVRLWGVPAEVLEYFIGHAWTAWRLLE